MDSGNASERQTIMQGIGCFFKTLYAEMFEIVGLNLLFLIFCLPVVTVPAACTAMSRVTLRMVRQESYSLGKDFWRSFSQNFGKSFFGGWMLFLGLGVSGYGALFYYCRLSDPAFYLPFFLSFMVTALFGAAALFLFPLIATIDLPLRALLRNAVLLPLLYPCRTLMVIVLIGMMGLLSFLFIPYTAPVILLLLFSVSSLLASNSISAGIRRCEAPEPRIDAD